MKPNKSNPIGKGSSPIKKNFNIVFDEDLELQHFDLTEIEPDPHNAMDVKDIERFAIDDIYKFGKLVSPITVRKMPSGKYRIISGERRWRAFIYLHETYPDDSRWEKIPGFISDIEDEVDASIAGILANYAQRDYTDYDKAVLATKLIELYNQKKVESPAEYKNVVKRVAEEMNVSDKQVYKYQEFAKAPAEIQEAVKNDKLAMSAVSTLMKADEETRQNIIQLINAGVKMSRDQIQNLVKEANSKSTTEITETEPGNTEPTTICNNTDTTNDTSNAISESENPMLPNESTITKGSSSIIEKDATVEKSVMESPYDVKALQKQLEKQIKEITRHLNMAQQTIQMMKENGIYIDTELKNQITECKAYVSQLSI